MEQAPPSKKKIKFICLLCDKVFDRAQRLQAHQTKPTCGTVCTRCKHKFRTRAQLLQHQKNASIKDCSSCNLKFCHLGDYNNHQRNVHSVNPDRCSTCSKGFSTCHRLENHLKNASIKDCSSCDLKFCHLNDYNNHQRVVHSVNPTQCTVCSKEFRNEQKLKRHQKKPVYNDCDLCDRKFCSDKDYSYHQIVDHHANPQKCKTCGKEYERLSELKKHALKAVPQACDLCNQILCTLSDYNTHRISVHHGGEIEPEDEEYQNILDKPIFAPTGMEKQVEYKATVERNYSEIRDKIEDKSGVAMVVNRELAPGFTFRELRDQLVESMLKHGRCAKFNIGFGFLLEHKLTHEFRYYYVSTNTMLFKTAHTISKRKDIKDIIEIIHDMNVGEHYYLMRPNSSWTVAGVTNMKFKLFYLGPVLE